MLKENDRDTTDLRNPDVLVRRLGLSSIPESWQASWQESLRAYPEADLDFLRPGYLEWSNAWMCLSEDALSALTRAVCHIARRNDLTLLAWHCHRLMFERAPIPDDFYSWPAPGVMGELSPVFYAVVLLPEVSKLVARHGERGIPAEVTVDTLKDIDLWLRSYKEKSGPQGLIEIGWYSNHFEERLYRIGRLQYEPQAFGGQVKVFRRAADGALTVFSEAGIRFRSDGEVDGTNGIFDLDGAWESVFEQDGDTVRGNRILQSGLASRETTEIAAEEWSLALSAGDTILNIHIPADGKMDHGLCLESFRKALEFFPRYRPDVQPRGFACHSWLLDPALGDLLPAESNIARFQREFYLYPVLGDDRHMFEKVFGGKPADLSAAPRDTLLRRVILDHVASGGRMHTGAGFILLPD